MHLLHLLQHLRPALRLPGLAGLGAEALDERLQLRAAGLPTAPPGPSAARTPPRAAAVVARSCPRSVRRPSTSSESTRPICRLRKSRSWEISTSALLERAQERVEPGEGGHVQVVGRLVEQQQVRVLEQQPRQRRAHPPAAGERRRWACARSRLAEAQPREDPLRVVAPVALLEVRRAPACRSASVWASSSCSASSVACVERAFGRLRAAGLQLVPAGHRAQTASTTVPSGRPGNLLRQVARPGPFGGARCSPASGWCTPARIFSSDVLPVPLAPTRPTRSVGPEREAGVVEEDLLPVGEA